MIKKILPIILLVTFAALSFWSPVRYFWSVSIAQSATVVGRYCDQALGKISVYFHLSALDKEIKDLKAQNASLESQITENKEIMRENEILRKELKLSERWNKKYNLIYARVLSSTPKMYWQRIVANKGTQDGVVKNNLVISQGYLIGIISDVYENYCYIDVISSNQLYLPVVIGEARGVGFLRGGLEGISVEEIPLEYRINEGDRVLTQNYENQIVAGIPVGKVKRVIISKGDIFQKVQVDSPIDIDDIETVTIINNQ